MHEQILYKCANVFTKWPQANQDDFWLIDWLILSFIHKTCLFFIGMGITENNDNLHRLLNCKL